jgi:hypothetical protein
MKCFDNVKENYKRNGMHVEWYIDKISVRKWNYCLIGHYQDLG